MLFLVIGLVFPHDPENLPILYYCVCNVSDVTHTQSRIGDGFRGSFSIVGVQFGVSYYMHGVYFPLKDNDAF